MTARVWMMLLAAVFSLGAWAGTLDLAVRGSAPEYKIVHAADASPSVRYAAKELRDFTARMTGVRLAITTNAAPQQKSIILSASQCFDLGEDGFRLKAVGGNLHVEGGKRGVLQRENRERNRFRSHSAGCLRIRQACHAGNVGHHLGPDRRTALRPVHRGCCRRCRHDASD